MRWSPPGAAPAWDALPGLPDLPELAPFRPALGRLLPEWRQDPERPLKTEVQRDEFMMLTKNSGITLPNVFFPKLMSNHGNFVGSLSNTCKYLGAQAEALGVDPNRMLKTLMAEVDGKPVCAVVPSDCEVSMKKLAAALGGKSARMMRPADAERLTGYHVGGISPFGQKKKVPTAIDETALSHVTVFVNGGQRGLQIEIDPNDAALAAGASMKALVATQD